MKNPEYTKAHEMLNPEQKKAVEAINGPVLVIAGPGTGKTQVLSLRIAEILRTQDGIETGNILCLTYTNAGVVAMRKRLLDFIGPEAHKVQIHTFHSFCNQVIQENAEYFSAKESENISELMQYECLENIVDSLPANHPLFHKSSYHVLSDLLNLFGILKQENWSVTNVAIAVEEYLKDLPNREEFQYKRKYKGFEKGDANETKIQKEREKMERLLAGVRLFPKYQEFLEKNGLYDFADMIVWIIRAFEEDEVMLAKYQEQFQYILVDEFQDTNGSQKRVVDLLCSYWEDPNIFVVGDDDQSIYRFQGANMRNIMEFYEQYKSINNKQLAMSSNRSIRTESQHKTQSESSTNEKNMDNSPLRRGVGGFFAEENSDQNNKGTFGTEKTAYLPYNSKLTEKARENRKNPTEPEKRIWGILARQAFENLKFTKQKPIGDYIVDFYNAERGLVIEVDGDTHYEENTIEYDKKRTEFLESFGLQVIRYTNAEVMESLEGVYDDLIKKVEERKRLLQKPSLTPPSQGESSAPNPPHSPSLQEGVKVITIEKNYRSSQKILDISEHIIEKNSERLVSEIPNVSKHLTAENPQYKDEELEPRLIEYYNKYHQELGIIKNIKAIQAKGIPLSEVAVIYQNHSQVQNILEACEQENIPVRVKETQNILDIPLIQQCLELLIYFSEEAEKPFSREDILFRSLFFSFFDISPKDIGRLALWRRENPSERHLKDLLMNFEEASEAGAGVVESTYSCNISVAEKEKLITLGKTFAELEEDYHNKPLVHFVESVFEKTGALKYVMKNKEKSFLLRAFSTLFTFIKDEAQKNPKVEIQDILDAFHRMQTHGLSLPIQKILYEKEGVNFITAHSSKGLEFEYVFLLGVEKRVWDKKRNGGFSFPDTLTLSNEGDFLEEKRRLFFVALTRAKRFVEVSYSGKTGEGKELDPSVFVSELQEKITPQKKEYSEDEINEYQMLLMRSGEQKNTDIVEPEMIAHILENYRMSATHLNKYLQCPLTFYFENLLRVPNASSPHAAFGTAIHNALEKGYRHAQETGGFSDDSVMQHTFETSMKKSIFAFDQTEFQKFLRHGEEVLKQYFLKNLQGKSAENQRYEYHLSTHVAGVPATGNLDRIDFLDSGIVRVVDYKTGKSNNPHTREKLEHPNEKNNHLGGDYWRQMAFYNLLIENNPRDTWHMREGMIDFVEPDNNGKFVQKIFEITDEDKRTVSEQVQDTYKRIRNMEFPGCQKEDCEWCNRFL